MTTVRISHTAVRRGRRIVLEPALLEVPARATAGVVGLNGAGKSTLFLGLADLLTRRAGRFLIEADYEELRVAYMPQKPALPEWLTVESALPLYGSSFADVAAACPGLRLDELRHRYVSELSGGQLQALVFAACWARRAHITLLDEPFANMDMARRRAALRLIAGRSSGLVLLSAQAAADLIDCCDWYVVLRSGRYAFAGSADELLVRTRPVSAAVACADHGNANVHAVEARLIELLEALPP